MCRVRLEIVTMPTTASTQESDPETPTPSRSWAGRKSGGPSRLVRRSGRRRRVPYLLLGVLLVVLCAAGAIVTVLRVGEREPALVLARDVSVGHVLTARDLRKVPVSTESGLNIVPAGQARSVLGKPIAYSLPAGTALSRTVLGKPQVPPNDRGLVAVALQPGRFPPRLAAGTHVSVVVTSEDDTGTRASSSAGPWSAAVVHVAPQANGHTTVVSLQLPTASARRVAAIPPGQLSLIAMPAGGQ